MPVTVIPIYSDCPLDSCALSCKSRNNGIIGILLSPGQLQLLIISCAVCQVQINKTLVGNTDLRGFLLEIVDSGFIEADGYLFLQTFVTPIHISDYERNLVHNTYERLDMDNYCRMIAFFKSLFEEL